MMYPSILCIGIPCVGASGRAIRCRGLARVAVIVALLLAAAIGIAAPAQCDEPSSGTSIRHAVLDRAADANVRVAPASYTYYGLRYRVGYPYVYGYPGYVGFPYYYGYYYRPWYAMPYRYPYAYSYRAWPYYAIHDPYAPNFAPYHAYRLGVLADGPLTEGPLPGRYVDRCPPPASEYAGCYYW